MPVEPLPFRIGRQPGQPPDPPRQPRFAHARAHRGGKRRVRASRTAAAATARLSTANARHAAGAAQLRPHRIRRAGFLPAHLRAGRRRAEAADGAGRRASEKARRGAGRGRQPGQAARHSGPGAHAAELLLGGRRADLGGGYGAGHYGRGARVPAAARVQPGWRRGWPATAAGGACGRRPAGAARGDPARAGAPARTALHEFRSAERGRDARRQAASRTWSCGA